MKKNCKSCKKPFDNLDKNNLCEICSKPKIKTYFDVRVECMLPATLNYRILAEDAEQAAELIKNIQPNSVKYKLVGRKDIRITVYNACCSFILYIKNLLR